MNARRILFLAATAACGFLAGCGPAPQKSAAPANPEAVTDDAPAVLASQDEGGKKQQPASAASRPSNGSGESRASTLTSPDVPADSRDPVVDGLKSIIREMILKGLDKDRQADLADRLMVILEIGNLGEEGRRRVQADEYAKALLDAQQDFRPKKTDPNKISLTADEEQKVRAAAQALAKDLYVKLAPIVLPKHAAGQHVALRAAPSIKLPEGYEGISWKTLGGYEYTEHMTLPPEVTKLDGKKVGVTGYMMTIEEVENIHEFLLVEAFWSCCFGTPPTVNQVLMIQIVGTKGVEYTSQPVLVLGTLEVGEKIEDGFVTSVYRLKATSVTIAE